MGVDGPPEHDGEPPVDWSRVLLVLVHSVQNILNFHLYLEILLELFSGGVAPQLLDARKLLSDEGLVLSLQYLCFLLRVQSLDFVGESGRLAFAPFTKLAHSKCNILISLQ